MFVIFSSYVTALVMLQMLCWQHHLRHDVGVSPLQDKTNLTVFSKFCTKLTPLSDFQILLASCSWSSNLSIGVKAEDEENMPVFLL